MPRRFEGSILKAKDGRWFARIRYTDKHGTAREKKRTCLSHAKAKERLKEIIAEVENEARDRKTYRELDTFFRAEYVHAARFVGGKKISGFRQDIRVIKNYLDTALAHFTDTPIHEIDFPAVERYKQKVAATPTRHGNQRSVADVNQNLRRLNRLFTVAIEQGWLDANPFKKGKGLIATSFETERTRILSTAEETRLLDACSQPQRRHIRPLVIFALDTAARKNEILAVRWQDVNFDGRSIRVSDKYTNTATTRLVPMPERLRATLVRLRQNYLKPKSRLFPMSDFKKAFTGACADAGLVDLHFHDLRHTAITRMLEKGISPPLVMKISGHSQMKTFLRYVNQSEQSVYEIARQLDAAA